jgi:hypothetical protein
MNFLDAIPMEKICKWKCTNINVDWLIGKESNAWCEGQSSGL